MVYQLMRTNISLTGNVGVFCDITDRMVSGIKLHTLINDGVVYTYNSNFYSTYGQDLVSFYKMYSDSFFNPLQTNDPDLVDNTPINCVFDEDKFTNTFITGANYGMERVDTCSYDKQIKFFAPFFIDTPSDIPDYAEVILQKWNGENESPNNIFTVFVKMTTDSDLGKYLYESLKYINQPDITSENVDIINKARLINISDNGQETIVRGMSCLSGEMINISSDVHKNMFKIDSTFFEYNKTLCDEYNRFSMVMPHMVNLGFLFNLDDLMPDSSDDIVYGDKYIVNVKYYKDGKEVEVYDIDFNHEFIKANVVSDSGIDIDDSKEGNLLDYTMENRHTSILDNIKNKMLPTVSKWSVIDSDNTYILNKYAGFGKFTSYRTGDVVMNSSNMYNINFQSSIRKKTNFNLDWLHYYKTNYITDNNTYDKDLSDDEILDALELYKNRIALMPSKLPSITSSNIKEYNSSNGVVIMNGLKYNIKDFFSNISNCNANTSYTHTYLDSVTNSIVNKKYDNDLGGLYMDDKTIVSMELTFNTYKTPELTETQIKNGVVDNSKIFELDDFNCGYITLDTDVIDGVLQNTNRVNSLHLVVLVNDPNATISTYVPELTSDADREYWVYNNILYISEYNYTQQPILKKLSISNPENYEYNYDDSDVSKQFIKKMDSLVIRNIYKNETDLSFNMCIKSITGDYYKVYDDNGDWKKISINNYITKPATYILRKPVYPQSYIDTEGSIKYKLKRSGGNSGIYIDRYFGWVQPNFIKIDNGCSSEYNYIYGKNISSYNGELILNSHTTKWDVFDDSNIRKINTGIMMDTKGLYNNVPTGCVNSYLQDTEFNWFNVSRCFHLYSNIIYYFNVDDYIGTYKLDPTHEDYDQYYQKPSQYFMKKVAVATNYGLTNVITADEDYTDDELNKLEYITSKYNHSIDISNDGSMYILKLTLK